MGYQQQHDADSHPLVLVEWEDAFGVPAGWEFEDEAPRATSRVRSVGYLIESDADGLMLVPHIGTPTAGRRQFAGHLCIPARQVVSVSSLALVPASSDPAPGSVQTPQGASRSGCSTDSAALGTLVMRPTWTTSRS